MYKSIADVISQERRDMVQSEGLSTSTANCIMTNRYGPTGLLICHPIMVILLVITCNHFLMLCCNHFLMKTREMLSYPSILFNSLFSTFLYFWITKYFSVASLKILPVRFKIWKCFREKIIVATQKEVPTYFFVFFKTFLFLSVFW